MKFDGIKKASERLVNSRAGAAANRFCNSPLFCFAIGGVAILSHSCNIPTIGAAMLILLLVPSLIFCKNSFVLVPFLLMCSFVMSEETMPQSGYYNKPHIIAVLCILLVFALAAFVFNVLYYKKWKTMIKRRYLTVSLLMISAALIVGGIFSPTYSWGGVSIALTVAITMLLPYMILINCGEYEGRKTVEYVGWALISVAVVIGAAILKQFAVNDFSLDGLKYVMYFGYAGPNTGAAFIVIAIPITYYFVYKYDRGFLFLLLVAFELCCVLLTGSRAALVIAVPTAAALAVVLFFKKKNGLFAYRIACGVALVLVAAMVGVLWNRIYSKLTSILHNGIDDSGRFEMWWWGLKNWTDHPILGFGYKFIETRGLYMEAYQHSFHCTPLTYMYTAGLVGLCAYIYHRYRTIRLVIGSKLTAERVFVGLSIVAMLLNALLDVAMNSPQHLLYYSILLALIECDVDMSKTTVSAADEPEPETIPDEPSIDNADTIQQNTDGEVTQ